MKKLIYIFLLGFLPIFGKAQLAVTDPGVTALMTKSNSIQVAIQSITNTSLDKLGDLGKLTKDLYNISKEYQDELKLVSNFVKTSSSVNDIFKTQKQIVDLYAKDVMKYDRNLNADQKRVYRSAMKNAVARSLDYLADLDVVITSNFSKMSDAERLKLVDDIRSRMEKERKGMVAASAYMRKLYNLVEINNKTYNYIN